jgi:hypothetical protein
VTLAAPVPMDVAVQVSVQRLVPNERERAYAITLARAYFCDHGGSINLFHNLT